MKIKVGDKIKFKNEKQRYTVQACDDRYLICTKPFNPRKTVLYTIVDLKERIRGRDDLIFCFGYETKQDCERSLRWLNSNELEISYRHRIKLDLKL